MCWLPAEITFRSPLIRTAKGRRSFKSLGLAGLPSMDDPDWLVGVSTNVVVVEDCRKSLGLLTTAPGDEV